MKLPTHSHSRKRTGIALAVTLLMLTVLTLITVAFFKSYQSHFSLTRSSASSEVATAGCESVFDYVTYRLEHDRTWGSQQFSAANTKKDPASPLIEFTSEEGTHSFSGKLSDSGAVFQGTIYNHLSSAGADDESLAQAPPNTAYCEIACTSGNSTKRVSFLVQVAPLFDSSVLSRSNLRVDASNLVMRSVDNQRNYVRAEGDIYVPDVLTDDRTKFYQSSGTNTDANGMLWSKGDIYSYNSAGPGSELLDTAQEYSDAAASTGGKVVSQAESHFSVFDLEKDQIKVPDDTATIDVAAGRWNFVRREATVSYSADYKGGGKGKPKTATDTGAVKAWVDVLEYYSDPESDVPSKVYRAADKVDDIIGQIPGEIKDKKKTLGLVSSSVAVTALNIPKYPSVEVLGDNELVFSNPTDPEVNVTFDLKNQQVTASNNSMIVANGPFHLTSETDPSAPMSTPPPVLNLGIQTAASKASGVEAKATIKARGTINIEDGKTVGLGALISEEGDVKIQPVDTASVTVDGSLSTSGLLIFAGGDVILSKPLSDSEKSSGVVSNWNFSGLIYARGGIRMNGKGAESATFRGTIVSLQENPAEADAPDGIEFNDCGDIEFIYDAKALETYVRQLEGDRIQVETVYWRD